MMTSAVLATVSENRRVAPGGFLFVEKSTLLLLGGDSGVNMQQAGGLR
jgi:hypothetical protein